MGNAPKAKHTDRVIKKLNKQTIKYEQLKEENKQLRSSVLNIRMMYEGALGEKLGLQAQLTNINRLLVAAVISHRGRTLRIKEKVLATLGDYGGIDTKEDDGDLILTALTTEVIELMEDEIEELEG